MNHIRVGDHDVTMLAYGLSRVLWRVAIICEGFDVCFQGRDHVVNRFVLILGQGFCREKIEGACVRLVEDFVEYG